MQMVWVGRCAHGCVRELHDPDTLTPQASLALRLQWKRDGLAVSLVPARQAIVRLCTHGQSAPQDLFEGVAP